MSRYIYIWGTGFRAKQLLSCRYEELINNNILGFIDNSKEKWGTQIDKWTVFSPEVLYDASENVDIYISTLDYYQEIKEQIKNNIPSFEGKILDWFYFEKEAIIKRYKKSTDKEIQEVLQYLSCNDLRNFNYNYVHDYRSKKIRVFYDELLEMYYVIENNYKMYFSKRFKTAEAVENYYLGLLIEQNEKSPHKYLTDSFGVEDGAVVVDAGAAEGMFTLSIINKASKVFLIEPDKDWCQALAYTFEPFKEKVVIVNKSISDYNSEGVTTMDSLFCNENIDFIKMDIEGEEYYALKGAEKIINKSKKLKCVVCTYHQEFAYEVIRDLFERKGFCVENSKGYMWFDERNNNYRTYVLRRGLIRTYKE